MVRYKQETNRELSFDDIESFDEHFKVANLKMPDS